MLNFLRWIGEIAAGLKALARIMHAKERSRRDPSRAMAKQLSFDSASEGVADAITYGEFIHVIKERSER